LSQDTDAYEVRDQRYHAQLGQYLDGHYGPQRRNEPNGWVMTSLLALLNILMAAGVVGIIVMYGNIKAFEVRFDDLDKKVNMIVEGRIRIPGASS
jgi:hypothetical protein